MKKRLTRTMLCLLMAAALMASGLTGCQKSSEEAEPENETEEAAETQEEGSEISYGGTFTYPISEDVGNFNPYVSSGTLSGETVFRAMFSPLYEIDKDETRYYLAENLEISDDGLSFVVTLREGITWSDGEPITVDDILFYMSIASYYANVDGEPVDFEKMDDRTLKVTLPSVKASYVSSFGKILVFPSHLYEGLEGDIESIRVAEANNLGVGSGPYKLSEWNQGDSIVLTKRDDYVIGEPTFDSIVFKIIGDDSAQELAYQNGDLTMKKIADELQLANYQADENSSVYLFDEGRVNFVSFNVNSDIMGNIDARKAVTYALNQEEIVEGAWGSLGEIANSVYPANSIYFDNSREGYVQDIEKAKELAESSGLTSRPIKIIYDTTYIGLEEAAAIIQQELKEIGVECEIQGYDTSGYNQIFFFATDGDWDIGLKNYSGSGDNHSISYMFLKGGTLTANFYVSDESNALWQAAVSTVDPDERRDLYAQLDDQIDEDYSMYRLSYPLAAIVANKNVAGVDSIPLSPLFEDWLRVYYTK